MSDLFNRSDETELGASLRTLSSPVKKPMRKSEHRATTTAAFDNQVAIVDCKKKLLDFLGTHFLICNEKIQGKGEDSGFEAYTQDAAVIGAFDGCGGLGSKTCPTISNRTEAYLASRAVGNAVRQWFRYNFSVGFKWDENALKEFIGANLEMCQSYTEETGLKLKGSMVRPFPSTIAMITLQIVNGKLSTEHFWAGDSRTYVLDALGIGQISVDDIKGEDAMSNLTRDGALTNVLSADRKFVIHKAHFEPSHPCIMMCSSDGCFGYVSSPMEFELMILSSLENSKNVDEWQRTLNDEIASRSGDDQTLALAAFGFSSFKEMKEYYLERYKVVLAIVQEFENADADGKRLLWEQYKPGYYRHEAKKE